MNTAITLILVILITLVSREIVMATIGYIRAPRCASCFEKITGQIWEFGTGFDEEEQYCTTCATGVLIAKKEALDEKEDTDVQGPYSGTGTRA